MRHRSYGTSSSDWLTLHWIRTAVLRNLLSIGRSRSKTLGQRTRTKVEIGAEPARKAFKEFSAQRVRSWAEADLASVSRRFGSYKACLTSRIRELTCRAGVSVVSCPYDLDKPF